MASLARNEIKSIGELLLLLDGVDDMQIILAYLLQKVSIQPTICFRASVDSFTNEECLTNFRFHKEHIFLLHQHLSIPEVYVGRNRSVCGGMEALLILLRRFAYPNRLVDLARMFGRPKPVLSIICNEILDDIFLRFSHLLTSLDLVWLDAEGFARAVHEKGGALTNCFGFVDGTARPCARPKHNQRLLFSGHKRVHCLKFQSVETPNGMIANCFGPVEGRRHDAYVLGQSGLLTQLEQFVSADGEPLCVYGDPAYPLRAHLQAPYRGANLTAQQQAFNRSMSDVRVSVEWGFGKIVNLFAYLDFRKNLKVLLQPIGKLYLVGALLTNCHTCLYSSQTSNYFNLNPPSLETYLTNQ